MIPMNAFTREPDPLVQAQLRAVERVIRSGQWILGKEVRDFEAEWSAWSGLGHTVGVANGTDALEIGMRALGICSGDEVITTPMTAFATALAILRTGATPVFADIDRDTAILDVASVRRCLSPRTKAVMMVHLYGQAGPVDPFLELCAERGVFFIEDCAQAHGARWRGKPVGSFGAFAGWSFYPTKNLGTPGDAGAVSTRCRHISEKARILRNYGQDMPCRHPVEGLNSRLDELHAAILRERLSFLPDWTNRRRRVARAYARGIRNAYVRVLPLPADPENHVHHLFVVTADRREALMDHLESRGIETLPHYPVPVHFQEPCRQLPRDPQGLPAAEKHAAECLSLPCHPFLTEDEVAAVIAAVNRFRG